MQIVNLSGLFTGAGFKKKNGRKVNFKDAGFLPGPLTLSIDNNGRIASIEKSSKVAGSKSAPSATGHNKSSTALKVSGQPAVDASGCIALAGFIDSHTHSLFLGTRAKEYFARWSGATYREISANSGGIHNTVRATSRASESQLVDALRRNLRRSLASGITTVEVKSGYGQTPSAEIKCLRAIKAFSDSLESKNFPQIVATFLALHALPKNQKEAPYVDSMIKALKLVADQNLATFVDAFPEKGFFTLKESLRLTTAARTFGLSAKIHADEMSDLGSAAAYAEHDAISVDHLQKISAKGIKALANAKTVATLLPATSFFSNLPYANARKLLDAGVRVALATDFNPGTAPEPGISLTLQLAAANFRMSSAEILCAATFNGAGALKLDDERGLLLSGYQAHLNLFRVTDDSDPQQSLEEIFVEGQRPWRTIIGEKVLSRDVV